MTRLGAYIHHALLAIDPALATALSVITTAIATAIIKWAAYMWPAGHHRRGAVKDDDTEQEDDNE